jgi:hypothetical protein
MRFPFGARLSRGLAFSAVSARFLRGDGEPSATADELRNKPERSPHAVTGSQFAESEQQREQAILTQLLSCNLPDGGGEAIRFCAADAQDGGRDLQRIRPLLYTGPATAHMTAGTTR